MINKSLLVEDDSATAEMVASDAQVNVQLLLEQKKKNCLKSSKRRTVSWCKNGLLGRHHSFMETG